MNSRVTLSDMKRRANNILEYISRTQIELASESFPEASKGSPSQKNTTGDSPPNSTTNIAITVNGNGGSKKTDAASNVTPLTNGSASTGLSLKEFKDMSCVEMMDILTRDLVKWQQEFTP